ncbi:MAG: hypothetical protein AAGA81_11075 [Acidobacteriota bacterium]
MSHFDVVILGSGFGGSILARCLRSAGKSVVMLERGAHPRFALGESSTPLGNLSLERLALRYGLEDLYDQAAWGRWRARLRRAGGLKRGFTFFSPSVGDEESPSRGLWVAASPDDASADSQWLRSSVDAALVERARREGARVLERAELRGLERVGDRWRLSIEHDGETLAASAGFFVDASGGARFAHRFLDAGDAPRTTTSRLVFSHFDGVCEPPTARDAPYSSAWSAVHHLLGDAWMYELRFADGTVSAGLLTRREAGEPASSEHRWASALEPWPWLARRFERARALRPLEQNVSVNYRARTAVGEGWAALPHSFSFVDPLFSTGIAWSLLGVERLAELLIGGGDWQRYDELLQVEATHLEELTDAAYAALGDFDRFSDVARTYFVAASFHETCQRLLAPEEGAGLGLSVGAGWSWTGLLGATDPAVRGAMGELGRPSDSCEVARIELLDRRDVAGLSARRSVYAVDLDPLRERAGLLGLSRSELERRLPRLFSPSTFAQAIRESAA